MRASRSLPVIAGTVKSRRLRMWHGRRYFPLFLWSQLEDVVGQQFPMISLVALERRRRWPANTH